MVRQLSVHGASEMETRGRGFTLLELLVVLGIIGILGAVLVPTLAMVKERGRRAVCQNHVHQFIIGLHTYGSEQKERLPSGLSDHGEDEHTPIVSTATHNALLEITGDARFLKCPWLKDPFNNPDSWFYQEHADYGFLIGYNYLGGHGATPWPLIGMAEREWISPQTTTGSGAMAIITELNTWTTGKGVTFAPHGARGPVLDYSNPVMGGGVPSKEIGAEGGHVGLLDASVSWRNIEDMKVYRGSRKHDSHGCFAAW